MPNVVPARIRKDAAEGMARVYTAVAEGYRTIAGIVKATKLPKGTVYHHLVRLVQAKRLRAVKVGRIVEYGLTAKPKAGAEFETTWTGTKERQGEAPGLSSVARS